MRQSLRRLITFVGVLGEQLFYDVGDRRRHVRIQRVGPRRRAREVRVDQFSRILECPRRSAREQREERRAERVEIGPPIDDAVGATGLFRREILERSLDQFGASGVGRLQFETRRDPEIDQRHRACRRVVNQVGRLDVLVNHAPVVDIADHAGDGERDAKKLAKVAFRADDAWLKRAAGRVFQHQRVTSGDTILPNAATNSTDVELARDRQIALEPRELFDSRVRVVEHLDHDLRVAVVVEMDGGALPFMKDGAQRPAAARVAHRACGSVQITRLSVCP